MQTRVVYDKAARRFREYGFVYSRVEICGYVHESRNLENVLEARLIRNGKALGVVRGLQGQDNYSGRCILLAYQAWVAAGRPESFCWEE